MVNIHWIIFDILIMIPMFLVSNFFFSEDGKYRKWLLRKRLDTIRRFCDDDEDCEVAFECKHKRFTMHVDKIKANDIYYSYYIYVNGLGAGIYHNLDHLMTTSSEFESLNGRNKDEVLLLIKKAAKQAKKALHVRELSTVLDREDKSFFS